MRIGIDARLIYETGVGRYIRNLITGLAAIPSEDTYILYLPKKAYDTISLPNAHWEKRCADVHWHTIGEQIMMPYRYYQDHLDILHVPYFNAPILYFKPYILTIHDLTIFHITTGKATRLPYTLYRLKKFGYMILLRIALWQARAIVAVSNYTKQELIDHFHVPAKRITVTYEGVDRELLMNDERLKMKDKKKKGEQKNPYFLYVGNAYPHKNLEFLVRAFACFLDTIPHGDAYKLFFVGTKDYFYERLEQLVQKKHMESHILFLGTVTDHELRTLYRDATAAVFPTLMEGFGLPVLEALALDCPVIASDIPVFRELFGGSITYIDPHDEQSLIYAFDAVREKPVLSLREKKALMAQFSWDRMAQETYALYTAKKGQG